MGIQYDKYSVHQCRHTGKYELWQQRDSDTHDVIDESYDHHALWEAAQELNRLHKKTRKRFERR